MHKNHKALFCPLCRAILVTRYRRVDNVRTRSSLGPIGPKRSTYWRKLRYCRACQIAVDINDPTGKLYASKPKKTHCNPD